MITFNISPTPLEIRGIDQELVVGPPQAQVQRRYFWGLSGVGSVYGGNAGRQITALIYLQNTAPGEDTEGIDGWVALQNYINTLDQTVGKVGLLLQTYDIESGSPGTVNYNECRFLGFERLALTGQDSPKPVEGICPQLLGWYQYGQLTWQQLNQDFFTTPLPP